MLYFACWCMIIYGFVRGLNKLKVGSTSYYSPSGNFFDFLIGKNAK